MDLMEIQEYFVQEQDTMYEDPFMRLSVDQLLTDMGSLEHTFLWSGGFHDQSSHVWLDSEEKKVDSESEEMECISFFTPESVDREEMASIDLNAQQIKSELQEEAIADCLPKEPSMLSNTSGDAPIEDDMDDELANLPITLDQSITAGLSTTAMDEILGTFAGQFDSPSSDTIDNSPTTDAAANTAPAAAAAAPAPATPAPTAPINITGDVRRKNGARGRVVKKTTRTRKAIVNTLQVKDTSSIRNSIIDDHSYALRLTSLNMQFSGLPTPTDSEEEVDVEKILNVESTPGGKSTSQRQSGGRRRASPPSPPSPASNSATKRRRTVMDDEKRKCHNEKERQRRLAMGVLQEDLRRLLPSLQNAQKASKIIILTTATEEIRKLSEEEDRLKAMREKYLMKLGSLKIRRLQARRE